MIDLFRLAATALLLGGLTSCGSQPIKVDPNSAKTIDLTVTMPAAVGAVPVIGDGIAITGAAGGWAIYADDDPVGYFTFDTPKTIQVPAVARTLHLNLAEHRFSGSNPLDKWVSGPPTKHGLVDISAFPTGSRITVTCNYHPERHLSFTAGTSLISCSAG